MKTPALHLDATFRAFLEAAPDAIVMVDRDGRIVAVNALTEAMFGYTREELQHLPVETLVPQRFRVAHERERDAYVRTPHTRPMGLGRDLWGRRKSGDEFPVQISLSPIETDDGKLVTSIIRDVSEQRRAEELIRASLREKEAMLKEIHHRVKNNLQITSSLLRLQTSAIDDPVVREMFEETQARIRSMALVHEKLYQSTNLSEIDLGDYIRDLGALLLQSSAVNDRITILVTGKPVLQSIETAVPCGLIVNELLSNALKHAFPNGRHGLIHVQLDGNGSSRTIRVLDDGVGMPSPIDVESAETLGLRLVRALAQQIDGSVAVEPRANGSAFLFTFPDERGR